MYAQEAQRCLMLELTDHGATTAHNAWSNEASLRHGGSDAQTEQQESCMELHRCGICFGLVSRQFQVGFRGTRSPEV